MKRIFVFIAFVLSAASMSAQDSEVILTIGDEAVSKTEFENIFKKNNKDTDVSAKELDEYMELFINFKLKVKEAEHLGMDTVQQFVRELAGYRDQLARPYLTDAEQNEALVREAYERKQEEIRASHILIELAPGATPADTLKAYKKIQSIRKQAIAGSDFAELALLHSNDPSAKENGGDLGYFSALQMVYPFENAAYNTPVGSVSEPVRTRFGYHIVKVEDRRPSRGEMKAAHIMIRVNQDDADERKELAEKQIRDIYQELQNGGDFADLALKYSDDGSTSSRGGELPWFGAGRMVEEFENAAFALSENNQISEPIQSRYGWHIIKRLDYKPVATFEEMESELKSKISKDSRAEITRKSFVQKLKKDYNFKSFENNLRPVLAKLDTNIFNGKWDVSKIKGMNKPVFEIDGKSYTQADFGAFLAKTQRKRKSDGASPAEYGRKQYETFQEEAIFDYEDSRLEDKYPAFKALMKEYRDGILLFELTDLVVWSKAVKDTTGLANYYEAHKQDFTYGERAKGTLYFCSDDKVVNTARKMAAKGKTSDEIRAKLNKKSNLMVRAEEVVLEKGDREYLSDVAWKSGVSDNFYHNGQIGFFQIDQVLAPAPKPLSEVRGLVTAAYQNHLEKEWLEELRDRKSVV